MKRLAKNTRIVFHDYKKSANVERSYKVGVCDILTHQAHGEWGIITFKAKCPSVCRENKNRLQLYLGPAWWVTKFARLGKFAILR